MRREAPGEVALYYHSETVPVTPMYWDELGPAVRMLATRLRALGVKPGDRVASTLPNIPAGRHRDARDHVDRGDLDERLPRLRLARRARPVPAASADGADLHRRLPATTARPTTARGELRQIVDDLTCLEHVIYLPFGDVPAPADERARPGRSC